MGGKLRISDFGFKIKEPGVRIQEILVQGTRCKVQGKALNRSHIIPCTLYPAPELLATSYLP